MFKSFIATRLAWGSIARFLIKFKILFIDLWCWLFWLEPNLRHINRAVCFFNRSRTSITLRNNHCRWFFHHHPNLFISSIRNLQIIFLINFLSRCQKLIDIDRTIKLLKLSSVFKIYECHLILKVFSLFHLDLLLSIGTFLHMGSLIFWYPIVKNFLIHINFMCQIFDLIVEFRVLCFDFALENCIFDVFRECFIFFTELPVVCLSFVVTLTGCVIFKLFLLIKILTIVIFRVLKSHTPNFFIFFNVC